MIEKLLSIDETAKIFVQVYGLEEDNNEQCITADTLIIFSKLSLYEIKQIFNEPKDIFPSDIREVTDFSQSTFLIDNNGKLIRACEEKSVIKIFYDNDWGWRLVSELSALALYITALSGHVKSRRKIPPVLLELYGLFR